MDPANDFNILIFLLSLETVSLACWFKGMHGVESYSEESGMFF